MSWKTRVKILASSLCLVAYAAGCGGESGQDGLDGQDGQDGHTVTIIDVEAGHDVCEFGGQKILVGEELNDDGEVDEEAETTTVHYVCDGEDGEDGASVLVDRRDATDQECPDGGDHFTMGYDTTGDGSIDTTAEEAVICHGEDGQSPEVDFDVEDIDDPDACDGAGGHNVTFSVDEEDVLSVEVCHGADGADGRDVLVEQEPVSATSTAEYCDGKGGWAIYYGYDNDGDGEIDEYLNENDPVVICHGSDGDGEGGGGSGTLEANTEVIDGCTHIEFVDENGSPVHDDPIVICDGEEGPEGPAGDPGCGDVVEQEDLDGTGFESECAGTGTLVSIYEQTWDGDTCQNESTPKDQFVICDGEGAEDTCNIQPFGSCVDQDISGWDLSNLDLRWIDLRGTIMEDTDFTGANLHNADLSPLNPNVEASGAIFDYANLSYADLTDINLNEGSLLYTDLTGADLTGAVLTNVLAAADADKDGNVTVLNGANLTGAYLGGAGLFSRHVFQSVTWNGTQCPNLSNSDDHDASVGGEIGGTCVPYFELDSEGDPTETEINPLQICQLRSQGSCSGFQTGFPGEESDLVGDLTGMNFSGTVFDAGTDFSNVSSLAGADFRGADLADANFSGVDLDGAIFSGAYEDEAEHAWVDADAILTHESTGVNFANATVDNAHFAGVEMDEAIFSDANAHGTDFSGASIEKGQLDGLLADDETTFAGADLSGVDLSSSVISGSDFTDVISAEVNIQEDGISFDGATAHKTNFADANLRHADFTNADLRGAQFNAYLGTANEANANLFKATFEGADLYPLIVQYEDEEGDTMTEVTFTNLRGAYLEGADFTGANAQYVDFRGGTDRLDEVDFTGTDLRGALLQDHHFNDVVWGDDDAPTLCPNFTTSWDHVELDGDDEPVEGTENCLVNNADYPCRLVGDGADYDDEIGCRYGDLTDLTDNPADLEEELLFSLAGRHDLSDFALDLRNTTLDGAKLTDADLSNAFFSGAQGSNVSFDGAVLNDANLNDDQGALTLSDVSFNDTTLDLANFNGANLAAATFTGAEADFGIFFVGATLDDVTFDDVELPNADFTSATFQGPVTFDGDLSGSDFVAATFEGNAYFAGDFSGADFTVVAFEGGSTDFTGATLDGADFVDSFFPFGADFMGVSFENVDLEGACGLAADTDLDGATFSAETICPSGHEAQAQGGTCTNLHSSLTVWFEVNEHITSSATINDGSFYTVDYAGENDGVLTVTVDEGDFTDVNDEISVDFGTAAPSATAATIHVNDPLTGPMTAVYHVGSYAVCPMNSDADGVDGYATRL